MRRLLRCLLLTILVCSRDVWCETPSLPSAVEITYDHFNSRLTIPSTKVRYQGTVSFRVVNINTFLYSATSKIRVIDYFTEPVTSAAAAFPTPVKDNVAPAPAPAGPENALVVAYQNSLVKLKRAEMDLEAALELPARLRETVYSDSVEPKKIPSAALAVVRSLVPTEEVTAGSVLSAMRARSQALTAAHDAYVAAATALRKAIELKKADAAAPKPAPKKGEMQAVVIDLAPLPADTSWLDSEQKAVEEKFKTAAATADTLPTAAKAVYDLFAAARDATYEAGFSLGQANGDAVEIDLDIAPISKDYQAAKTVSIHPIVRLRVSGGIKVDFSAGLMFSSLTDPSYVVDDAGHIARKGYENAVSIVPTVLMHVHARAANDLQFAPLSFGFGLGTGQQLNYFLGPSLIGGLERRLIVTGGVTAGQVKLLGAGLSLGDTYDPKKGTIPTDYKYQFGLFLGVTWNLGSVSPAPKAPAAPATAPASPAATPKTTTGGGGAA